MKISSPQKSLFTGFQYLSLNLCPPWYYSIRMLCLDIENLSKYWFKYFRYRSECQIFAKNAHFWDWYKAELMKLLLLQIKCYSKWMFIWYFKMLFQSCLILRGIYKACISQININNCQLTNPRIQLWTSANVY